MSEEFITLIFRARKRKILIVQIKFMLATYRSLPAVNIYKRPLSQSYCPPEIQRCIYLKQNSNNMLEFSNQSCLLFNGGRCLEGHFSLLMKQIKRPGMYHPGQKYV